MGKEKDKEQKSGEDLIAEKDRQIADYEKRIEKMEFDNILDGKLQGARARNSAAVRALLDMDDICVVDGKMVGADEQIRSIKAKDGYLFEGINTGGGANPSQAKEQVDLESLSDEEYFKTKFGK